MGWFFFFLGGATKRSVLVISHPALLSKEATPSSAAGELKLDEIAALSRDSQERAGGPAGTGQEVGSHNNRADGAVVRKSIPPAEMPCQ